MHKSGAVHRRNWERFNPKAQAARDAKIIDRLMMERIVFIEHIHVLQQQNPIIAERCASELIAKLQLELDKAHNTIAALQLKLMEKQ